MAGDKCLAPGSHVDRARVSGITRLGDRNGMHACSQTCKSKRSDPGGISSAIDLHLRALRSGIDCHLSGDDCGSGCWLLPGVFASGGCGNVSWLWFSDGLGRGLSFRLSLRWRGLHRCRRGLSGRFTGRWLRSWFGRDRTRRIAIAVQSVDVQDQDDGDDQNQDRRARNGINHQLRRNVLDFFHRLLGDYARLNLRLLRFVFARKA
jgi:hypothetical protein